MAIPVEIIKVWIWTGGSINTWGGRTDCVFVERSWFGWPCSIFANTAFSKSILQINSETIKNNIKRKQSATTWTASFLQLLFLSFQRAAKRRIDAAMKGKQANQRKKNKTNLLLMTIMNINNILISGIIQSQELCKNLTNKVESWKQNVPDNSSNAPLFTI